ncbi:MAG TPA: hypothetical protein DCS93_13810 [Microscillaceae bacterium]|nr:hypothetical protein [Microscillaceae bacterium]
MGFITEMTDRKEASLDFLSKQNPNDYVVAHKFLYTEGEEVSIAYVGPDLKKVFDKNIKESEWSYVGQIASKISIIMREINNQSITWIKYHDLTHFEILSKEELNHGIAIVI